ncbi:amino acid transporter, partial [Conidiobolus coronatus NRRL 28638]
MKSIDSPPQNDSTSTKIVKNTGKEEGESIIRYKLRCMVNRLDIDQIVGESQQNEKLSRNLTFCNITAIGIGGVIGTGIFVLPGILAAQYAGPGVVLSFILAGIASFITALSFAELGSMIPVAGCTYTYLYASMGELVAWTITWGLLLESFITNSGVCVGWSGYFMQLIGIIIKDTELKSPWAIAPYSWNINEQVFEATGGYFNFPASIIVLLCTLLLIKGTKESTLVTTVAVIIKISVILIVIFGIVDHVNPANWTPFIPENTDGKFGHFGFLGILKAARIAFVTYSGFESLGTVSQECINPSRNIPLSIITTLGICGTLYISVCLVLVGVVPYTKLNVSYPISIAIRSTGRTWLEVLIIVGTVVGAITTIIFGLLAQSRILYTLSNDGLLPKFFTKLTKKTNTPFISLSVLGITLAISAGLLPLEILAEFTGIISFISFFLVNLTVVILRLTHPNLERGFKIPLGNYFIPTLGACVSLAFIATGSPMTLLRIAIWLIIGVLVYL